MTNEELKQLLDTAEKVDGISNIKWRIENREQLRKERKEKLKELMTNKTKQKVTAVEWLWEIAYNRELTLQDWQQAKEMEKEQRCNHFWEGYIFENRILAEQYYEQTYGGNK